MKSVVIAQTMSAEAVTCIAVKDDRHQNIMRSVALKKGVEEPWTLERVAKFIDLLGYREITLKSDTGSAIIAFRNRVAEMFTYSAVVGGTGRMHPARGRHKNLSHLARKCWQSKSPQIL